MPPLPNIHIDDPYAPGGLRVWDDYGFRRKGIKGGIGQEVVNVAPIAPINLVLPDISGTEINGFELACSEGSWIGTPPIAYGYQWYRADTPVLPANTVLPVISGPQVENQALSCSSGAWTGTTPIAYMYQWYRS
jgi:hypothetical protein